MSNYKRYKKNSTIEKKVLEKYGLLKKYKAGGGMAMAGKGMPKGGAGGGGIPFDQIGSFLSTTVDSIDTLTGEGKTTTGQAASGALKGAGQGASMGAMAGPIGMAIGAGVGGLAGGVTSFMGQKKKEEAEAAEKTARLRAMANDPRNSPVRQLQEQQMMNSTQGNQILKMGGKLDYYQQGGLTEYNGLKHQQGGLPIGDDSEVEDGETRKDDFIYSDSIAFDKGVSFADQSKKIDKKYSYRPNDQFSLESKERELSNLANQQEMLKGIESPEMGIMRKGGCLRKKFFKGGEVTDPPENIEEIINAERAGEDFNKTGFSNVDLTTLKGYDPEKHSKYSAYFKSTGYETQPRAKVQGKYTNAQADAIVKKALVDGDIKRAMSWGKDRFDRLKKGTKYDDKLIVEEDTLPEEPEEIVEEPGDFEDVPPNTPVETKTTNYKTPKVKPLRPDRIGVLGAAVPGLIGGIGNLALGQKVDYDRVAPEQIRLEHLDPTRAIQNQITAANTTREGLRQNTRASRYASGLLASQAQQARGTADVLSNYDNQNVNIDNKEREINFDAREKALYTNADIQRQELQDKLGFQAAGISGMGNAVSGAMDYRAGDKRFREYQQLLHPDYVLGRVNGETRAVPRSWAQDSLFEPTKKELRQERRANKKELYSSPNVNFDTSEEELDTGFLDDSFDLPESNNSKGFDFDSLNQDAPDIGSMNFDKAELPMDGIKTDYQWNLNSIKSKRKLGGKLKKKRRK